MIVKWLQKLKIPNFSPSSDAVVCYRHFHEHDIGKRNLKLKISPLDGAQLEPKTVLFFWPNVDNLH